MREFTEDDWRFRVTVRRLGDREVEVRFYDTTLPSPSVDDVFCVTEDAVKDVESVASEAFSIGPFSWTTTTEREVLYDDLDEQVEVAMKKAYEKIEEIDCSPSEQFHDAVRSARRTES